MIVVGLTGSIGMGKTTTADLFSQAGVPVHSSDAAVHKLYAGAGAQPIEDAFPGSLDETGTVDRARLARQIVGDADALKRLEAIVHPLVRAEETAFIEARRAEGADLVVLDVPLLFESGAAERCDRIVVVTCDEAVQRERVMAREGMSEQKFERLLARQTPDAEKRERADFVIDTGNGILPAKLAVQAVVAKLRLSQASAG